MQNTFIVVPSGRAAPAFKSMSDAAFGNLSNAPVFAPQKGDISIVAGYRFVGHLEVGVAVPRTETFIRHNQANFAVEVGKATWNASGDVLSCITVGRQGHTTEIQLQGASFKVDTPSKLQIGIISPEQDASILTPLPLAVSFFTGQDNTGVIVVNQNGSLQIVEGWEITADAFIWKSGGELIQSYPRSVHIAVTGATVGGLAAVDTTYGQPVALLSSTPLAVTVATLTLTDNRTGAIQTQTVTMLPKLVASDRTVTTVAGTDFALDIATLCNLGRANLIDYSITGGVLPQGLTLVNGILSGVFGADRLTELTILVTDLAGQTDSLILTFNIKPQTNVSIDLPPAVKGAVYRYIPRLPVGFESIVLNAPLPAGLQLNPATGEFFGTIAAGVTLGSKPISVTVTVNGSSEVIELTLDVMALITVSYSLGDNVYHLLDSGVSTPLHKDALISLLIDGGSHRYAVSANNGAVVSLNNQVQFLNVGDTILTVIDRTTRAQVSFTFTVTAQEGIFAYAVNSSVTQNQKNRPLVCEVGKPLVVGFARWTIIDYDSNRLLKLLPINADNFAQVGEGTPFALFTSKTNDAKLQMPRAINFVSALGLDDQIIISTADVIFGLGRMNDENLKYAVAITTVNGVRMAEIRVGIDAVENSRVAVTAGQVLKVAIINGRFGMYLDGTLRSSVAGDNLSFWDFIVITRRTGLKLGGQITGLEYSIVTEGTPDAIGTIHPQTGLYTPSDENVSVVSVKGQVPNTTEGAYQTDIVVIRGSVLESFARAKLQNRPLYVWIGDQERGDNKRLRFTEDGRPDANQIRNAVHVGKLQASGKWDAAEKRNDFSNDTGVYDTGYILTKYTITGNVLNVINPRIVKTLVPFIEVHSEEIGSLAFSQKASGCIPRRRVVLVWESTACLGGTKTVWDAIEFPNAKSFTPFNWEIGSDVATHLAMSIEAYPDEETNHLWHLYRFDSQFVEL